MKAGEPELAALSRYRDIIDDWDSFVAHATSPVPYCFWVNTLKISEEALLARFRADGIESTPLPWLPGAHRLDSKIALGKRFEHLTGLIYIQEEVSMVPVAIMNPQPGERVLDMAASPGGKTYGKAFWLFQWAFAGAAALEAARQEYMALKAAWGSAERLPRGGDEGGSGGKARAGWGHAFG